MNKLIVDLGKRSYPIHIGHGLLHDKEIICANIPARQVMVVTNETIAPLYLDQLLKILAEFDCKTVILPDGEQYKTLEITNQIYTALLENRFNRTATLIALGGGVIGDITGFAAATYQRGINFIQIPTTLLAQVDSSVGGKTGVNHALGKNMIGAFYQPLSVVADTKTLETLDDRQLSAGIAEIIKYGIIRDPEFFTWLESNIDELTGRNPDALAYAITRSCQNKADVVKADEMESGQRALLNLGHTFGHAIETGTGYGTWLHGEAVAIGMDMAAEFSERLRWITQEDLQRIRNLLIRAGLPVTVPQEMDTNTFMKLMAIDKKVLDGKLRLVLLKGIGNAIVTDNFEVPLLEKMLDEMTGN